MRVIQLSCNTDEINMGGKNKSHTYDKRFNYHLTTHYVPNCSETSHLSITSERVIIILSADSLKSNILAFLGWEGTSSIEHQTAHESKTDKCQNYPQLQDLIIRYNLEVSAKMGLQYLAAFLFG